MVLEKIRKLSKVAADNMEKEAQMDDVIGTIAVESMERGLETGNVKVAEDALEDFDNFTNIKTAKDGEWVQTSLDGKKFHFHNVPKAMAIMKRKDIDKSEKYKQLSSAKLIKNL